MPSESHGGEMRAEPITPEQAELGLHIPEDVVQVFNSLIEEKAQNGSALVYQDEVVSRLEEMGINRQEIFDKGWLNVEGLYRGVGWNVKYDKPGFNETYRASFLFSTGR